MQIYLVGGAVRDQLLGRPHDERDYVVVGASPEEMTALGFKPVGKEFPVFIHPKTGFEYALARTERKIGKGYKGFEFFASPDVTLEEDLKRRDLTINAMAETDAGTIVDPYGGQEDLKNKILRHVSPAFAEDPVRILRIARFAARFPDFQIHSETLQLMRQMVKAGEVDALVAERVWQEFAKALQESHPERFFETLKDCGALEILFAPIAKNFPQAEKALQAAVDKNYDTTVRFAVLFANTNKDELLRFCEQLRVPVEYRDLALLVSQYAKNLSQFKTPEEILNLLEKTDAFRRPERFNKFLQACDALDVDTKTLNLLRKAQDVAAKISVEEILKKGLSGKDIGEELKKLRLAAINSFIDIY